MGLLLTGSSINSTRQSRMQLGSFSDLETRIAAGLKTNTANFLLRIDGVSNDFGPIVLDVGAFFGGRDRVVAF